MKQYTLKNTTPDKPVNLKIDYAKELNAEQLAVVKHADGPCLVLAGAGSGKTRTLVYRVAWLLEHGVSPQNILLVTFTNKASREMLERVRILLKQEPKGLWGGTFHHIGNRILRKYITKLGYTSNFAILDAADSKELASSAMRAIPFDTKQKMFPKSATVHSILSFAANAQKPIGEVVVRFWSKYELYIPQFEAIQKIYQDKKKNSNALDYDDLLVLWLQLLQKEPVIKQQLATQFKYILVDEYQDTNYLQASIVHELASVHGNVLVVGDDAQSIYSFRAADINNILDFPKRYKNAQTFKLETNYRSTQDILSLANESIKYNTKTFKKELRHVREGIRVKPGIVPLPDGGTQATFLIQRILESRDEGIDLRDMAVLFRAAHLTLELEVELARHNIPYVKRGGLKYFEQAHIKDLVAYLKIVINPKDEISWMRILKLYDGVGEKSAEKVWEAIAQVGDRYLDLLRDEDFILSLSTKVRHSIQKLTKLFVSCKSLTAQSDVEQLGEVIKKIVAGGYRDIVRDKYDDADERLQDLAQLAEFAKGFGTVEQFLSDVALSEGYRSERYGVGEEEEDDDILVLSTIHQAKGLEWNTVFVIGLVEGQFPHSRSLNRLEDLEEERRLFYVAVTRAKDELYLLYTQTSFYGSGMGRTLVGPSRFLTELPDRVYEPWEIDGYGGDTIIDLEDL